MYYLRGKPITILKYVYYKALSINFTLGPPDVPSALGVIPLGADTLELSWKPPFSPPGVNTSYTVLVSDLSAPSKEPALTVGPILEPRFTYHAPKQSSLCSQRYEFRVMARNDAGEGYPSTPLITSAPAGMLHMHGMHACTRRIDTTCICTCSSGAWDFAKRSSVYS